MSVQEDSNNEIEKKHKQGKDEINTNVKVNDDVKIILGDNSLALDIT